MKHYFECPILWQAIFQILEGQAHFIIPRLLGVEPFDRSQLVGVALASIAYHSCNQNDHVLNLQELLELLGDLIVQHEIFQKV